MASRRATEPAGDPLRFALAALATWRVSHMLAYEDGPGDVVVRAREFAGHSPLGGLIDCFDCLTVWVAAPIASATAGGRGDRALAWLGLSGAACLIERTVVDRRAAGEDQHVEMEVDSDGMLRPAPSGAHGR